MLVAWLLCLFLGLGLMLRSEGPSGVAHIFDIERIRNPPKNPFAGRRLSAGVNVVSRLLLIAAAVILVVWLASGAPG